MRQTNIPSCVEFYCGHEYVKNFSIRCTFGPVRLRLYSLQRACVTLKPVHSFGCDTMVRWRNQTIKQSILFHAWRRIQWYKRLLDIRRMWSSRAVFVSPAIFFFLCKHSFERNFSLEQQKSAIKHLCHSISPRGYNYLKFICLTCMSGPARLHLCLEASLEPMCCCQKHRLFSPNRHHSCPFLHSNALHHL